MGGSLLWRISLTRVLFRLCYAFTLTKKLASLLFISSHISCSKASAVLKGCATSPDTSPKGSTLEVVLQCCRVNGIFGSRYSKFYWVGLWRSWTGLCWYQLRELTTVLAFLVCGYRLRSLKTTTNEVIYTANWIGKPPPGIFGNPNLCFWFLARAYSQFLNLTLSLQFWRKPFSQRILLSRVVQVIY